MAQAHGGDIPVIDFAAHLYPNEVFPDDPDDPDSEAYDVIGPVFYDPDLARDRFLGGGVDAAVFSQPYYMGHDDESETAAANDALLDIVENYEEFYGLAALPVGVGGEKAAAELERCLEAGYHGGAIETMSNGIELIDDAIRPVYEVAERYDAPLLVHPKLEHSLQPESDLGPDRYEVLTDKYRLNSIVGREAALIESICKVIHEGVFDEFEALNLVFHHTGGNIASMLGRLHLHLDVGRFPGQESLKPFDEFKRQLEARVYLDTAGFFGYHAPIRLALEELPSSCILFGTDAPAEPRSAQEYEHFVSAIRDVTSETDADRVLGGNALDLLANT